MADSPTRGTEELQGRPAALEALSFRLLVSISIDPIERDGPDGSGQLAPRRLGQRQAGLARSGDAALPSLKRVAMLEVSGTISLPS